MSCGRFKAGIGADGEWRSGWRATGRGVGAESGPTGLAGGRGITWYKRADRYGGWNKHKLDRTSGAAGQKYHAQPSNYAIKRRLISFA